MSLTAIFVPIALSIIVSSVESLPETKKKIAAAPMNNGKATIKTKFNDSELLKKTLLEHGIDTKIISQNCIVSMFPTGQIRYTRSSEGMPFVMEISNIADVQCLINEIHEIEYEYNGHVQQYTYDRVINNLPKGMAVENEEVLEDDSILITLNVE